MRDLQYIVILLIFISTGSLNILAQSYPVTNYTEADGLPSSTVYDVTQDSLGRMWFATRNGICNYDGYNWEIFNTQSGLPSNDFVKIKIDKNGNVWALSADPNLHLFIYNGIKWTSYHHHLSDFGSSIPMDFDVKIDKDTSIAIATGEEGLILYENKKWIIINKNYGLKSNKISSVVFFEDGLYAATNKGLSIISKGKVKNLYPEKSFLGMYLEENKSKQSRIWLLSKKEIGIFENENYEKVVGDLKLIELGFPGNGFILPTGQNNILFGTEFSIFNYDVSSNKLDYLGVEKGLISEGAYSIFMDREKIIWIVGFRGISKIVSLRLQNYTYKDGLLKAEVTSVVERNKGELVFGHFNGLTIFDGKKFTRLTFKEETKGLPIRNRVQDLQTDKNKNIWIAAEYSGIGLMDINNKIKWFTFPNLNIYNAYSVAIDSNGTVFAATSSNVYKFNGKEFEQIYLPAELHTGIKRKLFFNSQNEMLIATSHNGIILKDAADNFKLISSTYVKNANDVFSIYPNKTNNFFVGTLAGLFIADSDTLKKYQDGKFKIDRPVYFIERDNNGSFWFGTDNGVVNRDGDKIFNIGFKEGIVGLETNRDAGFVDSEGNFWIGTNNGVSKYTAKYDRVREAKPIIFFEKINSSGTEYSVNEKLDFDFKYNDITFYFKAVSLIDEQEIYYKTKLDGFDDEWLDEYKPGNPQIRYTNLPPGKFKLRVKAKNAAGVWSREIVSPLISIDKPYYQQFWFYILVLIIFSGIIILVFMYSQKNLYSKKLKNEVELRTSQLYETQERYRRLFEENSTIMLLIDAESLIILDANPSAKNFYGYSHNLITTFSFNFFESETDLETCRNNLTGTSQFYIAKHNTVLSGSRDVEVYPSNLTLEGKPVVYIIINDITERLIAEKVVQESEEKFRGLVDNIQDGVFLIQKGIFQYCNYAYASMLGYKVDEVIGQPMIKFIAPESRNLIMENYRKRQIGEDTPNEYEAVLLHKNGYTRVYVNIHAGLTVLNNEVATIGTIKNISEKKKQDEQLAKLSTAVEQSPVCVFITDPEARIEYVNPMFSRLYGYKPEEVVGNFVNILRSGNSKDEDYANLWQSIKSGKIWRGELLNKSKSGNNHWVAASIAPVTNSEGIITHYIAVQEDITFDKYAREEIENNEKLLNSVLSNVPLIIFALDQNGIFKVAKGTILSEIGFGQTNLVGQSAWKLQQRFEHFKEDLTRALSGESFSVVRELDNVIAELTFTPIIADDSKIMGTIGIAYDITERFKFEQELKEAKQEAEKSDRLKTEFLAQMSHEIRTPINSVLSFSSLIKDHLEGQLGEELAQSFEYIEAGGRRLIRTIDMILNMSQFQTGTYEPTFEIINLDRDVILLVINELSSLAAQKGLNIAYSCKAENTVINGDKYTVGQIFVNLIENAIKYTFEGKIEINLYEENDSLVINVSDTGIGISEEFLPALFSPFLQEERGYTRKYEGNGLGLALVRKYVDLNGADVSVLSEKGLGSTFTVKFKRYN